MREKDESKCKRESCQACDAAACGNRVMLCGSQWAACCTRTPYTTLARAPIPEIDAFMNYCYTCSDNWCKRSANFSLVFVSFIERDIAAQHRPQCVLVHFSHSLHIRVWIMVIFMYFFRNIRLIRVRHRHWNVAWPSWSSIVELVSHCGAYYILRCYRTQINQR